MKLTHAFLVGFIGLLFFPAFLKAENAEVAAANTAAPAEPQVPKTEDLPPLDVDFETYQSNIDDIFHIALMANPNVDFGINSVIVDLNRKIAQSPSNPQPLISLGHVYRLMGQPSEANRFYEKALQLDPQNFHLNLFSAMTSFQKENFDAALQRLNRALRLNPEDVYPLVAKGRLLMILHRDQEAIETFQQALKVDADNRQAAFALSLLYQKTGRNAKAKEILEKLKAGRPEDLFVRYHLGALALAEGNAAKAVEQWQGIFQEGVRDVQFLFSLAVAYLESGQSEQAETILEHLHFFLPEETAVEVLLAEAYRQLGRIEEAESRYRVILAENPDYLSAYLGLAQLLDQQGKTGERDELMDQASARAREIARMNAEREPLQALEDELSAGASSPDSSE